MPLSELVYRLAKGKFDSSQEKNPTCSNDLYSGPENDFVELVWENGQIQSSRGRKIQISSSLPSQTSKIREKDIANGNNTKTGRFGAMDSVLGEVPVSVPSVEMGLNQEDDMVPWLNYPIPIDDSLQHDYCPEFMTELSGVTVNENSQNNYASLDKRSSGNQLIRDSHAVSVHNGSSLEQGHMLKVSSTEDGDAARPRTSASQLYPSLSQQCQASFPYFRSRISVHNGESINNPTRHASSGDSIRAPSPGGCFPSIKAQKQIPLSTTNSSLMNFSHFSRPASLVKANLHNIGTRAGSGISSIERMGSKDKGSIASSSNPVESTLVDTFSGLRKDLSSHCHPVMLSSKVDAKPLNPKPTEEPLPAKQPEALDQEDDSKNDKSHYQIAESATRGLADCEKIVEPVVASSSVCSGNSVERVSDEPTQNLKRKHRETEESEGPSEDAEEESVGVKKPAPARGGTGSKRSRAAEVHNLSERRRRDRINEKMRALQELIPNCNKVDKASMLDEAIEYLKTLQLQVQIMSMGAGFYMPSMMLPPGLHHMHAAHMAQFSPMGVGMGFGMGMPDMIGGSSGCSMIQMPPMHGAHFPGLPMSGPSTLHGMGGSNLPIFGLSSQGHPMPYPCAPLMPMSGGPLLKTARGANAGGVTGSMDNLDLAPASCSKDSIQNVNSQTMQNCGANSSMNQTPGQCQVINERFEQPALVQNSCQASEVTDSGALKSANGNDNVPGGAAAGCD